MNQVTFGITVRFAGRDGGGEGPYSAFLSRRQSLAFPECYK